MPKNRKTRAQKQTQSVKRTLPQVKTISFPSSFVATTTPSVSHTFDTYTYVLPDLRKTVFLTTGLIVGELFLYYIVQTFKLF